jgi:hypothetical protein
MKREDHSESHNTHADPHTAHTARPTHTPPHRYTGTDRISDRTGTGGTGAGAGGTLSVPAHHHIFVPGFQLWVCMCPHAPGPMTPLPLP